MATSDARVKAEAPTAAATTGSGHTHAQILKSSLLVGGSSVIDVVIGMVRVKAAALLLGPSGFGLMGLYISILNLAQSLVGMGINNSGVRQIAVAVGSGDTERIALTAAVLRKVSVLLGLLGAVLLALLSVPISRFTFGTAEYAVPVALLGLAVLFRTLANGQRALIQGLRHIADLAKITVLGGLLGTIVGIAVIYVLRERGVVSFLVAAEAGALLFSWWFSRKAPYRESPLRASQFGPEAAALLKLGLAFLASGLFGMGAAYAVRIMIVRSSGLEEAGLYQSGWTLGGLYVGFILRAMGTDFYPRLTAAIADHRECNRLVNEQAEVSMLLAGPGILATLALTPLVIPLLYSSAFAEADDLLRWICLGAALQVITWPFGYIIVAEGKQRTFFLVELAYTVAYLGLAWLLVARYGANGAAVAFFCSYIVHGAIVYPIARRHTGFGLSATNRWIVAAFLGVIGLVFGGFYVLPFWLATAVGLVATALSAVFSARTLIRHLPTERLPRPLRRLLELARLGPARGAPGGSS
jgi:PST family polysaccharide transporter